MPGHRPHAGREVDFAPVRAPRRAGGGDVGHPRPVRRRRRRRLVGRRRGHGGGRRAPPRRPGGHARRPGPTAPARRATRLREFGHVDAPADRAGGGLRLGDRADRRRVTLGPAHGPRGRAARAHGRHRDGPGRALPAARARPGRHAARHRLDRQGRERAGEVGHPPRRPVGRGDDHCARAGHDARPHRGDADRGGGRPDGRALGRRPRRRRAGVLAQAGRPDGARRPVGFGLLRRGGVRRPRQRRRHRRRLRRPGPARLHRRPAAHGRLHHAHRRPTGDHDHPGHGRAAHARPRSTPARSRPSTRSLPSRWPPPWPAARRCSPTSASCG